MNVGALARHRRGMRDGRVGVEELAAVGKRIRGDVEDAHDQRPALRQQRGKRVGAGFCRGSAGFMNVSAHAAAALRGGREACQAARATPVST